VAQRNKTGLSAEEAFEAAWRTIVDVNPFPASLGRICPHPCEQHCNRSDLDEPLAINAMERFLGDHAIEQGLELEPMERSSAGEWIGVVGAGPSGLSFAYQMARRGYSVTVYEEKDQPGGMLRYGVPEYRLPQSVLDAEIDRILALGVELELGVVIGRDISLEELRAKHTGLYLGMGAQKGRGLGLPGEKGPSYYTGVDYLAAYNCGEVIDLGPKVLVVGGGNSAMDAARTARRGGAEVTVIYRRTREEMPAVSSEVEDALEEGVKLTLLAAPVAVERTVDGVMTGIKACCMELTEPDSSGRKRPKRIPGSEFFIPATGLIAAVSQSPAVDGFEALEHEGHWPHADTGGAVAEDVLAGGDVLGLGIAGNAIVQGRRAAERLHLQLTTEAGNSSHRPAQSKARQQISSDKVMLDTRDSTAAAKPSRISVAERMDHGNAEVAGSISKKAFLAEVDRCFSCGSCFGCEQCSMFCTPGCFTRLEEVGPGMYFSMNLDSCEECGKCIEVCPCGFLEVSPPSN
jgi:NADPH-dependent glutamate synthase beta subunit-like oxidoreductase/Pyruvate/2-oxoacid:ferredoxin oxidoreductase delta subunit